MKKLFCAMGLMALTGCCAYSQLQRDVGSVRVDGRTPKATYEVVNVTYKLLGLVPITTGVTWKEGPYSDNCGSMTWFSGECSLDDNLASVRHACKTVGSDDVREVVGRVDESSGWSFFIVKKRIVKTSCVIMD